MFCSGAGVLWHVDDLVSTDAGDAMRASRSAPRPVLVDARVHAELRSMGEGAFLDSSEVDKARARVRERIAWGLRSRVALESELPLGDA